MWLTCSQAARRLNVEPSTIRAWIRDGLLPAVRTPGKNGRGRFRVNEADLALAFDPVRRRDEPPRERP